MVCLVLWVLPAEGQTGLWFPPSLQLSTGGQEAACDRQSGQDEKCFLGHSLFWFITLKSLQVNIHSFVFNLVILLPDLHSFLPLTGCHEEVPGQWQFVCHGTFLYKLDFYLVMNQATGVQSGKKKSVLRKQAEAGKFFSPFRNKNALQCAFFAPHQTPVFSKGSRGMKRVLHYLLVCLCHT